MKLDEQIFNKQVSTTLTSNQFERWQQMCKQENKSSFTLLREIVLAVLGEDGVSS
jgi:hypothetical protein